MMNEHLLNKLSKIKIVVSDVDGILTDGTIIVSKNQEFKTFHVEDALGTRLLELLIFQLLLYQQENQLHQQD